MFVNTYAPGFYPKLSKNKGAKCSLSHYDGLATIVLFVFTFTVAVAVELLSHVRLLCNAMVCSLPGYPVHGMSQARILEWVAISFPRGSSWPRDKVSCVSCTLAGEFFTTEPLRKPPLSLNAV